MNKYKTELYDVTFDKSQGKEVKHVTITHRKSEQYLTPISLSRLCIEVEELLEWGRISKEEAIKIVSKSAEFFLDQNINQY